MNYSDFVSRKLSTIPPTGLQDFTLCGGSFDHQEALTRWALNRGRAAIFADTGLGKTRMQISWADAVHRHAGHDVLILAPLAVAEQTRMEGEQMGVAVNHCRDGSEVHAGITITNYDRLHRFDPSRFGAVVLDESSIIKHHDSKTLKTLLDAFRQTPFKLCATATPAPNDWTELGTHAEFLGICTQQEMLSEYFLHDGGETQDWRLKKHARGLFWKWVATWAAMVRKPSDLGFDDSRYNLPPLTVQQHTVSSAAYDPAETGMLFALEANTLSERRAARKGSLDKRVDACALLVKAEWSKLAETSKGNSDAVEEGIRGKPEGESSVRSNLCGKNEGSEPSEGQSKAQGIQPELLSSESGQVSGANPRTASEIQRQASKGIRGKPSVEGEVVIGNVGMAEREPAEATCAAASQVRDNADRNGINDGITEPCLCDMRMDGTEIQDVSDGRSLSYEREGSRNPVFKLQHGDREVQGQSRAVESRSGVSLNPWLIWCDLNVEQDALEKHFGNLAFSVRGSMEPDEKEDAILRWMAGERPVMISKPSIMGWGINAQHCNRIAFVGVTDSWEAYYQAVRRCWRFGQKRPVDVHIFASDLEGAIVANLKRKEADAKSMADSLSAETHDAVMQEVRGITRESNPYSPARPVMLPAWLKTEETA